MTSRQLDPPSPAVASPTAVDRPGPPGAEVAWASRPDPLARVAAAADGGRTRQAVAAALDRASGVRLDRAGPALLTLQRHHGNHYVQDVVRRVLGQRASGAAAGTGRPLDRAAGDELGQALGADLSHVKVHTDERADRLSRALGASAFTIGGDIFFRANRYDPTSAAGRRLLAHELTHVVQQGSTAHVAAPARLAPADDPSERAADRVAGEVVSGRHATPPAHPGHPLIQRKVFIGQAPTLARRGVIEDRWAVQDQVGVRVIPRRRRALGTGDRRLSRMVSDAKSRYFRTLSELYRYARRETDDIGYVDREKTWVRLPDQFLVLGERHNGTTVDDLAEATGTDRYISEAGTMRPSPYLHPGEEVPADAGRHALEELLPKLVVGLIGVEAALQERLNALRRDPGWEWQIRARRRITTPPDPDAARRRYKDELDLWSYVWEVDHEAVATRGTYVAGAGVPGRSLSSLGAAFDLLYDPPPNSPYARDATEMKLTRLALGELRTAARGNYDPITRFYVENQQVINKTIAQLDAGLPLHLTRLFLAVANGTFDLQGLIGLLTTASEQEFAQSGATDASTRAGYQRHYETAAAGHRMEELRDSYMLQRILDAKAAGYRVAGLGDNHRKNLKGVLALIDPDILVKRWTEFYADQYREHPDRA